MKASILLPCVMSNSPPDSTRLYAVHVRLATHPDRHRRRARWVEPPLGLGYNCGHYEIIGQSTDLRGLTRWVLGFGAGVEVLGPDALRERVAREARRIATRHSGECVDAVASG
jgi:predicted DNA-binding transcriptional regulator YafY